MADITWIKIKTDMFDNEKIKLIERMPEGDTILIIWIKLLTYAGKANYNGYIMLSENIPMNIEEMAIIFNRPLEKVRYAIQILQRYKMLEVNEHEVVLISNWEKHQNIDGLQRVRALNAKRNKEYRERKKQLALEMPTENSDAVVTSRDATDIDKDIDKEYILSGNKPDSIPYKEIIEYLNQKANKKFKHTSQKTQTLIKARFKEKFTLEDFKQVIDIKTAQWLADPKMSVYLRPETLFGTKFEGYLNEQNNFVQSTPLQNQSPVQTTMYKPINSDMTRGEG
ncbi:phage replisome organizer N-terminal domain-containing protein [Lysinibacillus pakistanensis]|uniref:Phage replisome organizer N-terminal domain-containing protein n=1 Tax=Lysinibacillus pakistanensis TaxID=759811 RepID=A0AAX3WW29_9BACI|nr:phage replisome organizer N-terminal domain-containing protein [Lysinibacillus pakistanensis]MDM5231452.1 phage replisome organizer N-terminal domain-containing protein [Lysinibacillus pakistanensis]WHY46999.1 phage replisome organizer N-terminal domain-containing protein [Lysinibacillus pakistanensis]WHY52011.1 phage replisome organizer N-terminal domain-containing protein [Lysinibacillus pakistanensis]